MFSDQRVKVLVVTCAALFMSMLDNLVLGVALPSIQKSFHASLPDLEWFTNAYTLAFAVLLIPFSMLGERIGRKKIFLAGVVLFTLGSALSGMSHHSLQLIFSRALQGVGGAAIVPLSLTLVNTAFPEKMRAVAMGIWSGISGLGLSVGPLVGGLILNGAPWQLIFWINMPVGILAMFLGLSWLPESKGEASGISNATREFGGVFGIAICTLIFESGKKITSPEIFSNHMVPSLLAGAGFIALALGFVMVLFRGAIKKQSLVETEELGKRV